MPLMSQAAYSRKRKVSRSYIAQLIKSGKIPGFALRRVKKRVMIYGERADAALESTSVPEFIEESPKPVTKKEQKATAKRAQVDKLSYGQAKTEYERFRAGLKKMQFQ